MKIAIIGTSPITEQHIKSIKKLNGEIALISSTRKNSRANTLSIISEQDFK